MIIPIPQWRSIIPDARKGIRSGASEANPTVATREVSINDVVLLKMFYELQIKEYLRVSDYWKCSILVSTPGLGRGTRFNDRLTVGTLKQKYLTTLIESRW